MTPHIDNTLTELLTAANSASAQVDALFMYMHKHGQSFYDEAVTQLQHALQSAHLARGHDANPEQITASLLHDIGHFLMEEHDETSDFLHDDWCHEIVGADYLQAFFPVAVTEPIRLHVPAKRYLCSTDAEYFDGLSQASQRSFQLQGGPMTAQEIATFAEHPFQKTAVLLRRWDDGAKVNGLDVPELESYREVVAACLRQ